MCDCLLKVQESLKTEGYLLNVSLSLTGGTNKPIIDSLPEPAPKGKRRKPSIMVLPSFCPWCGEEYPS